MDAKKKPSFIDRVKQALTPKNKTGFRDYSDKELQCLLIKTRVSLENGMGHRSAELDAQLQRLNGYREIMENDEYLLLAEIAERVVELKALKLLCVLLRRLEEKAGTLLQARGNPDQIQQEVLWLQNLLWYRKVKKCQQLDEVAEFTRNYFRGVDIVEDSSLQSRLYAEMRLAALRPTEIPFDLIHNDFQGALGKATHYPVDRKARMFDLNRSNMNVLKVLMDEQRITGATPYAPTGTSTLRTYGNNTSISQIRAPESSALNKSAESLVRDDCNPGYHEEIRQTVDAHLDKDEVFSMQAIRKYYTGQPTKFPDSLKVEPFKQ